jgi:hypothetical protein
MANAPYMKMPEFHGDPSRFPGETWKAYKDKLELAYMGMANPGAITDKQKVAHMLQGLRGKAAKFYELTPDLISKTPSEVSAILEKQFGRASLKDLLGMSQHIQKPGETVLEYVARLRAAAAYMNEERRDVRIVTKEELEKLETHERVNVWTQEEYDRKVKERKEQTEEYVRLHFVNGLRDSLRREVFPKNFPTLEMAVREAEAWEKYYEMFEDARRDREINMLEGEPDIVQEAAEHLQALNPSSPPPFVQKQGYSSQKEERSCFNCGRKGHLIRECRQPRQERQKVPPQRRPAVPDRRQIPPERQQAAYKDAKAEPMTKVNGNQPARFMQPRLRDLRIPGAEDHRGSPPRNTGEFTQNRYRATNNKQVSFAQERNQSRGRSEVVNTSRPTLKPIRDASNNRPVEKNGVRPPQRGGFSLPKPLYQKAVNVLASRVRSQR